MTTKEKVDSLTESLRGLKKAAVAFSGGVDSTLLLTLTHEILGDACIAVTAKSRSFPEWEREETRVFCEEHHIRQIFVSIDELQIEGFADNPPDRCYLCKKQLFLAMKEEAAKAGFDTIIEGSNRDDEGDYRPGMRALKELGILSPLQAADLTKAEIREISKELSLPTASKPSFGCLATRFVYGEPITEEKLSMVERAENVLFDHGFHQVRVRIHGNLARIEVAPEEISGFFDANLREEIDARFKTIGFSYVTLDLLGYRTGSMNETLDPDTLKKGRVRNV